MFLLLTPLSLYAAAATSNTVFGGLGDMINSFNGSVVKATGTLFLTLAVVVFFYGIVQFIWSKREGKAEGVKVGQSFMAWGLLALFVMFSVWGIISFFGRSLGIQTGGMINIPSLDFNIKGVSSADNYIGSGTSYPVSGSGGGNSGSLSGGSKVPADTKRPSATSIKISSGGGDSKSYEECYYGASDPNYLDGSSCTSSVGDVGICRSAECIVSTSDECYFSSKEPDYLNGSSCLNGGGTCNNNVCVPNRDSAICPSGNYDEMGTCLKSTCDPGWHESGTGCALDRTVTADDSDGDGISNTQDSTLDCGEGWHVSGSGCAIDKCEEGWKESGTGCIPDKTVTAGDSDGDNIQSCPVGTGCAAADGDITTGLCSSDGVTCEVKSSYSRCVSDGDIIREWKNGKCSFYSQTCPVGDSCAYKYDDLKTGTCDNSGNYCGPSAEYKDCYNANKKWVNGSCEVLTDGLAPGDSCNVDAQCFSLVCNPNGFCE